MDKAAIRTLREKYEDNLFNSVVPFWERYSLDRENGGYYSCLERDGTVFDTDKFAWMQTREIWTFAKLYNRRDAADEARRRQWLELARSGTEFLKKHGRAPSGDLYFSVDRAGLPLVEPYNIFAEYFFAAGLAEFHRASKEQWAREMAESVYRRAMERKPNPKGIWTKQIGKNRPIKAMGSAMMDIWLAGEMEGIIGEAELNGLIDAAENQIFTLHVDRKEKAVFERVLSDGTHLLSCMEGRLLNPGHALETLWFLMLAVAKRGEQRKVEDIADIMLWCAERGWDEKYGGFFYYQDFKGFPTEKLESDMKLWWVHAEALCAFLLAYKLTGRKEHLEWFTRVDEYIFSHFVDPEYGEWYGYLDRRGEPAFTLKGGKWKGFFHTPRALMACIDWLKEMERNCAE
ncbi:AGE family epimerase/isomerase [Breznakiella homolactica]|uniref:AGE family epimerase/isomerase n=1 Tax=Breznakiella homolactica TaxID=2798577 RepID=A0A7T7XMF8_9SPIR|nr:AGE family epimerase/isomerase [Breznakiella homolactica]QQO08981.1 AGE family epimerase/isomerase [Breznakiella homolactica]